MSSFNDFFYKNLGRNVRKFREQHGLTQEKLAEILDLNDKYIGHIERNEKQMSHKVAIRLMELWQIQPKDFYTFDETYKWDD